jgi:hypothetical protein
MPYYPLLVYAHILLMVFWLGTDLGVFIAGLYFLSPRLSLERRRMAIELGLVVDRFPRICFVLMLPVGLQLAFLRRLLPVSAKAMIVIWIASLAWMTVVIGIMRSHGTARGRALQRVERVVLVCTFIVLTTTGTILWRASAPVWLVGKLWAFASICLFAILLEISFGPSLATFTTIATHGSTAQLEEKLRRSMYWTYAWVLGIYAAVLVAGFLGTVKP